MITAFVKAHPYQSLLLVLLLLGAGAADSVGLSALLPLLTLVLDPQRAVAPESLEAKVTELFASMGIPLQLGAILALLVGSVVLKNLLMLAAETRVGFTGANVTTELRMRLLRAVMRSRWDYFIHQSAGSLANSLATEAWRSSLSYIYGVRVLALVVEMAVYFAIAVTQSWVVTLVALVSGGLTLLLTRGLVRMTKRAGKRQTKWYRSLLSTLTDTLASVKPFKAMGRVGMAEEVLATDTHRLGDALKSEVFGTAGLEATQEPLYAVIVAVGIFLAFEMFAVDVPTLMFMLFVFLRLLRQVGKVQKQYQKMVACESAYVAIHNTIRDAEGAQESAGGTQHPSLVRAIEFAHVGFSYGSEELFSDLNFVIEAGKLTCLVGSSGAGKTTIIDLLIGLHQPNEGAVLIDGIPLSDIDRAAWRRCIGYVPQDNLLLHDSICHNVTLGDPSLSASDAERALAQAGLAELIAQLAEGIESTVGERGARFSGGERQRIMIARALAHRPKLLILDEATSALDPSTEQEIARTIAGLRGELTIVAVSHQRGLVGLADRVYRLERGKAMSLEPKIGIAGSRGG